MINSTGHKRDAAGRLRQVGVVVDGSGDYRFFFSLGPSVGLDASIGIFSKGIYSRVPSKGFAVNNYQGYGSAYSGGIMAADLSFGGANNVSEYASHFNEGSYYEVGAGSSVGSPFGLTWQGSYTWLFGGGNLHDLGN